MWKKKKPELPETCHSLNLSVLLYHQEFGIEMKELNNAAGLSSWNVGKEIK